MTSKLEKAACNILTKLRNENCEHSEHILSIDGVNNLRTPAKCQKCKYYDDNSDKCKIAELIRTIIPSFDAYIIDKSQETMSFGTAFNIMNEGIIVTRKSNPTTVYTVKNGALIYGKIDSSYTDDFHISWIDTLIGISKDLFMADDWIKLNKVSMFDLADDIYLQELEKYTKL